MTIAIPLIPFDEAFFWALWYNGWDDNAEEMMEYIGSNSNEHGYVMFPRDKEFLTKDDVIHDNPNSLLWMALVGMFGNYGTSPRYGWIEHPKECVDYLREMIHKTWGISDERVSEKAHVRAWKRR